MKKEFDCVDFQDEQALRIYEETRGLSLDEELAYWRREAENSPFRKIWEESAKQKGPSEPTRFLHVGR